MPYWAVPRFLSAPIRWIKEKLKQRKQRKPKK